MVAAWRKSIPSPTGSNSICRFQGPCPEKIFLNKIKLGHTKPESREIHCTHRVVHRGQFRVDKPKLPPLQLQPIGSVCRGDRSSSGTVTDSILRMETPHSSRQPTSAQFAPNAPTAESNGRLFRPMDWLTFVLVTLFVMAGYLYTVAPDLTLEDSGELAVG